MAIQRILVRKHLIMFVTLTGSHQSVTLISGSNTGRGLVAHNREVISFKTLGTNPTAYWCEKSHPNCSNPLERAYVMILESGHVVSSNLPSSTTSWLVESLLATGTSAYKLLTAAPEMSGARSTKSEAASALY